MRKICIMFVLSVVLVFGVSSARAADYRLGYRDVLAISVWGVEKLQMEGLVVRDDGKIAFPLIGEIDVVGHTPEELTSIITNRLSEYYYDPKVTVNVAKMRTTRVHVLGEVSRPGMYELEKQHNLLDAIGAAGGYTKAAAKKRIYIIPKENMYKPVIVDFLSILKRGNMSQNMELSEGDVVFITGNHRIDFSRDVLPIITSIYSIIDD